MKWLRSTLWEIWWGIKIGCDEYPFMLILVIDFAVLRVVF